MPLVAAKDDGVIKMSAKMPPELELFVVSGWGKCPRRLERVFKRKPNVNWKNEDGKTALHEAAAAGSADFVKKLLEAKADPNVPATESLVTPLEWVIAKINYEEDRDQRLNGFDEVNRLDDTCLAIRPNLKGLKEVRKVLEEAGGVSALAFSTDPVIKPDGSIKGGPPSELRSYRLSSDGSYTASHYLRTGKFDLLKYEDGKLVEAEFDPSNGHWGGFESAVALAENQGVVVK